MLRGQPVEFIFPLSPSDLEEVSSLSDLKERLRDQLGQSELRAEDARYRYLQQKGLYMYARCRWKGCKASLSYKRVGEMFRLTGSKCRHHHSLPQAKKTRLRLASQYMTKIPGMVPPASLKRVICPEFGLNDKQFYYILSKVRAEKVTINDLVNQLEKEGFQIYLSGEDRQQNSPPELLIAVSDQMRHQFARYGDSISFDLTFQLVKNRHNTSSDRWKVGVFLGVSSCKHLVPLGIVLTLSQTADTYTKIFKTFFDAVRGQPRVIITDDEKAIGASLREMKEKGNFAGSHRLDLFHVLHNLRKKLTHRDQILLFSRLAHARNDQEFQRRQNDITEVLPSSDKQLMDKFIAKSHLYCFSKAEPVFFGFSLSSSPSEVLHSIIKKWQPSQKEFSVTLRNLVGCCNHLLQRCQRFHLEKVPYEDIYHLPELRAMKMILSKPIFAYLIDQLASSIRTEVVESRHDELLVHDHGHFFPVNKLGDLWHCQCGYSEKCHLPCRHLFRVIVTKDCRMIDYVGPRWKSIYSEQKQREIKLGREKLSKRRIMS